MSDTPNMFNRPALPHDLEQMQQLTIYINETDRIRRRPLYLEILHLVKRSGGSGATVFRGIAGYSSSNHSITIIGLADLRQRLPIIVIIVDFTWRIELLLPQIGEWVRSNGGLVTIQDLQAHRYLTSELSKSEAK
jgi:hypothetical protein